MSNSDGKKGGFSLNDQAAEVTRKLEGLEKKLRGLEDELATHADQRVRYQLLGTICTSLAKLEELGASDLFWGGELAGYSPDKQLQRVRGSVAEFESKIGAIESVRDGVQAEIDAEEVALQLLNEELAEQEREAERKAQEFVVSREGVELPYRAYLMPWSKQGEDEKRYRKIMAAALAIVLLFTTGVTLLRKPPEKHDEVVIPDKIAELVVKKKEQPKPKPVEPAQTSETKSTSTTTEHATTKEAATASAKNQGVLGAGGVSDLLADSDVKLGSDAHVTSNGKIAAGDAGRGRVSVIGSQATGGSGGIGAAGLATGGAGAGGGGNSITGGGVKVATVQSSTAAGVAAARPKAGAGPARTDEDIQIVFDKYKAALYRIYNRELRNDPTLRGKMVLKITIEPDGHVSACVVATNELGSATLAKEIVDKVLTFNFGAKTGVPPTKITYPIDFLPAT